jgi:hypothetical protein
MKNILIIILCLISFSASAQILPRPLGNPLDTIWVKGKFKVDSVALAKVTPAFSDSSKQIANTEFVKRAIANIHTVPGIGPYYDAIELIDDTTFRLIRNDLTADTIVVHGTAGGGGTNIYNSDGTLTGNRAVDGDGNYLVFSDLSAFSVNIPVDQNGNEAVIGAEDGVMMRSTGATPDISSSIAASGPLTSISASLISFSHPGSGNVHPKVHITKVDTLLTTPSFFTVFHGDTLKKYAYTGSGVTTMAAIGSSPNANGATISGSTLTLQPANGTHGGVLSNTTQTIAGDKTFNGVIVTAGDLNVGDDLIVADDLGASGDVIFDALAPMSASDDSMVVRDNTGKLGVASKDGRPYKSYVALLSQTASGAPTATVLENTLGVTVTYSYNSSGDYGLTATGALTANKTFVTIGNPTTLSQVGSVQMYATSAIPDGSGNDVSIIVYETSTAVFTDDILVNTPIEIRVYP